MQKLNRLAIFLLAVVFFNPTICWSDMMMPQVSIVVGTDPQDLDLSWDFDWMGLGIVWCGYTASNGSDPIQHLNIFFDQDPYVDFGVAVKNPTSSTINFSFTFSNPVSPPVGATNIVQSSFSGSYTDSGASPDGSVAITALAPAGVIPVDGDPLTEMMVTRVFNSVDPTANIIMDLGPTFTATVSPGSSGSIPSELEGPSAGPAGTSPWTLMKIDLNFSLSPNDIATLNGRSEIVPIPSAVWLLGSGLIAFIGIRRRSGKG